MKTLTETTYPALQALQNTTLAQFADLGAAMALTGLCVLAIAVLVAVVIEKMS